MVKRILYAWELGGGLGHLLPWKPIVAKLAPYEQWMAVKETALAASQFPTANVLQAPVKVGRPANPIKTLRTYGHILHNNGYSREDEAVGHLLAWRNLIQLVAPSMIVCDHGPSALLASRGLGIPCVTLGTGFCSPPPVAPMPDFRPWLEPDSETAAHEQALVQRINVALERIGAPTIEALGQIFFEVEHAILTTFHEMEHYPQRETLGLPPSHSTYWGSWSHSGGAPPSWPSRRLGEPTKTEAAVDAPVVDASGLRIFAYLKRFRRLSELLRVLEHSGAEVLVYCSELTSAERAEWSTDRLVFSDRPVDLDAAGAGADLGVLHAGHGATCSLLRAGVPLFQVPLNLEQTHNRFAVERMQAGVGCDSLEGDFQAEFEKLVARLPLYRAGAERFAKRYRDLNGEQQVDAIAARIRETLEPESASPPLVERRSNWLIGIGSCPLALQRLSDSLTRLPSTVVAHEMRPLLPWCGVESSAIVARLQRLTATYPHVQWVGETGHAYLPYLRELLATTPCQVICVKRPQHETIASFRQWLRETRNGAPVNHWSRDRAGLVEDPWDVTFPSFDSRDLSDCIGEYWELYETMVEGLRSEYPSQLHEVTFEQLQLGGPDHLQPLLNLAPAFT